MLLKRMARTASPLVLLLLAIGCQGSGATPSASTMSPQKAVAITTGNGTTTVLIPSSDGTGVARLAGDSTPACKQCEEDSEAYFKGGTIAAKCPVCGATRVPLHAIN
jgi:hypothetical protein